MAAFRSCFFLDLCAQSPQIVRFLSSDVGLEPLAIVPVFLQGKGKEATKPDQALTFEGGALDETIFNALRELLTSATAELQEEAGRLLVTRNGPAQALLLTCNNIWTVMREQLCQSSRAFFAEHLEPVVR